MKETWTRTFRPLADPRAIVRGEKYRISVLTSRLLRLEYREDGRFRDSATQMALCRHFPVPAFSLEETEKGLILETEHLRLRYDRQPFSSCGLSAEMKGAFSVYASVWHFGEKIRTLGGTAGTLDEADGEIPLEDGLAAFRGYAVLDDSASMSLGEDGQLRGGERGGIDLYLFAYGRDFHAALRDFLTLSGPVPPVPRFALGNWWSRFYPYTQEEYIALMERFRSEGVPLSVAVLDMNWHVTEIDPQYGPGWTGYTWDREKFPDPEKLIAFLHALGLKVTLNDHPADGVRPCEENYPEMARAMGEDPASGKNFPFDAADPKMIRAMEDTVIAAQEARGVDFWWLDWQQQGGTTDPGMDPLFVLNHTRYLRALRLGHPALILSRFAGPGSHRYPLGFSGDTCITWASLAFQPRFTATAANIGYGWWSHDIGGHMHGAPDPELTVRWVQFGVFSPILRLHSSNNPYMHKEPWLFPQEEASVLKSFLRLRHRLIPWLYTRNVHSSESLRMMLRPLYYDWPEDTSLLFRNLNQYLLGEELTVAPVTRPMDPVTRLAETEVYLPRGVWTDVFTGLRYRGGRRLNMFRPLHRLPVLAKPGAILPLDGADMPENGAPLPETVLLRLFPEADGDGELIEDNGLLPDSPGYRRAVTRFRIRRSQALSVEILPPEGDTDLLPPGRRYRMELNAVAFRLPDRASCAFTVSREEAHRALILSPEEAACRMEWDVFPEPEKALLADLAEEILREARIPYDQKPELARLLRRDISPGELAAEMRTLAIPESLFGAILELLTVF